MTGRACQVNFQSLASLALAELERVVAAGGLGRVTGIAMAGTWMAGTWLHDDACWTGSPWVGRRQLDGRPVADVALSNPFAHGVMNALVLARATSGHERPAQVDLELYRVRDIEVDDTACLRATFPGGLRLPGDPAARFVPGRVGMLEQLLAHRGMRGGARAYAGRLHRVHRSRGAPPAACARHDGRGGAG